MALSSRERYLSNALMIALAALLINYVVLGYYRAERAAIVEQLQSRAQSLAEAQRLLDRERQLRQAGTEAGPVIPDDVSTAENQLVRLIRDSEEHAGAINTTFTPVRAGSEFGFTRPAFSVAASGSMASISIFLYRLETAPIPLRLDDLQLGLAGTNGGAGGEQLQIHLSLSTLCRHEATQSAPSGTTADAALTAGGG